MADQLELETLTELKRPNRGCWAMREEEALGLTLLGIVVGRAVERECESQGLCCSGWGRQGLQ